MSKALLERKNDCITRAEELLNQAKAEERELTEEEAKELNELRDRVKRIEETMKLEEDFNELEKKNDDTPTETEEENAEMSNEEKNKAAAEAQRERRAFENYVRGFVVHERAGELTPATTSGGALIPTTIANQIIKKVYDICPILERSQKFNVKGKLDVPYYPADSNNINVAYATEFTALSSSSGKFATVELSGFLAGALTKISRSLINNVQFNLVDFVVDEMAYAIKRFVERELLRGTQNKVTGLSTLTNGITAAAANAITAEEVIKLHDAVKDEFQGNAMWIMSPATRTALRLLKANTGYFLLNDDVSTPFGTSILGKPVYVSDNMPDIATGVVPIYYGDMRGLGTKFAEEINIEVLRERFADEHAVGVVGWLEFDGKVINEQAIAKLTMA